MTTSVTGGEVEKRSWISAMNMDANVQFVALLIVREKLSLWVYFILLTQQAG
jgi:hypothetical protein